MKRLLITALVASSLVLPGCAVRYASASIDSPNMGGSAKVERMKYKMLGDTKATAKGYYFGFPLSIIMVLFGFPKIDGPRRGAALPGVGTPLAAAAAYDAIEQTPGADMLVGVRTKVDRQESWFGLYIEESMEIRAKAVQLVD